MSREASNGAMSTEGLELVADEVVALGDLAFRFSGVDRAVYLPDGQTHESDTDHTVMLSVIACSLAAEYRPDLDLGKVAQFAIVHDFPEVYAGDTPVLRITPDEREQKEAREAEALHRITEEFQILPWLPRVIAEYERLDSPEARFVKTLDKLLPKISHILNGGVYLHETNHTREELTVRYAEQPSEMHRFAFDQELLMELREVLSRRVIQAAYDE